MKTYSMMVVDDERVAREHILKDIAWETLAVSTCYEAGDGREALALLREYNPDIVILDLKMPGMDGLAFLRTLRQEEKKPQIIALSGYSDFNAAREMLASGLVADYLLKPASEDAMFEAVYRCIDRIEERERVKRLEQRMAGDEEAELLDVLPAEAENCGNSIYREDSKTGRPEVSAHKAALVREVKQYLAEHYAEHITLEDAARVAYINPSYLSKIFPEVEQMGFNDYLTRLRVQKAMELLADYHLKIYEISELVGYQNVKHFMKVFKKVAGKTPSEFRESLLII